MCRRSGSLQLALAVCLLGGPALTAAIAAPATMKPLVSRTEPLPVLPVCGPQFFAIAVQDVAASGAFYRDVFGLTTRKEIKADDDSYHVLILGSDRLVVELGHGRDFRTGEDPARRDLVAGVFKVGFYVADLARELRALAGRGISPVAGPFVEADLGIRSAVIRDNEGNAIQLFERLH